MADLRIPIMTVGGRTVVLVLSSDTEGLDQMVAGFRERFSDPAGLYKDAGKIIRADYRRKFASGGNPRWTPLKERTRSEKRRLLNQGAIPRRTPTGRIPRRLMQNGEFTEGTILIRTGRLRDSWCVKGARGNVEDVSGDGMFVGSQLTLERELPPDKDVMPYHILTKKAWKERGKGRSVKVMIPLARIHEEGAPNAHIPPRSVAVDQGTGEPLLDQEAWTDLERAVYRFATGESLGETGG